MKRSSRVAITLLLALAAAGTARSGYVNFESSHVHPIDLTPSGDRLLVVNTPDALLEIFSVQGDGSLDPKGSVPVGLEPVTVIARSDTEAWVVNNLSDTISIVDLTALVTVDTLAVGDEPVDVAFAEGRAFVAVSQEDAVKVYNLADLTAPPIVVPLFGRDVRALAVSNDGSKVYVGLLRSGNQTAVVNANIIQINSANLSSFRLAALRLRDMACTPGMPPPTAPSLWLHIWRNPKYCCGRV